MILKQITKILYKMSSDTTKILIDRINEHPENFGDFGYNGGYIVREFTKWESVVRDGTFPPHEYLLVKISLRQAKLKNTHNAILDALMNTERSPNDSEPDNLFYASTTHKTQSGQTISAPSLVRAIKNLHAASASSRNK